MKIQHGQRCEYGDRTPRVEQLVALADFLAVFLDCLIGRPGDPARPPALKKK